MWSGQQMRQREGDRRRHADGNRYDDGRNQKARPGERLPATTGVVTYTTHRSTPLKFGSRAARRGSRPRRSGRVDGATRSGHPAVCDMKMNIVRPFRIRIGCQPRSGCGALRVTRWHHSLPPTHLRSDHRSPTGTQFAACGTTGAARHPRGPRSGQFLTSLIRQMYKPTGPLSAGVVVPVPSNESQCAP